MTWVKICGITNLEDARVAAEAGADALGFVFYEKSPRRVEVETVRAIVAELPARIEKVGVFVDQIEDSICGIAMRIGLTAVQLHGDDEDPHVADRIVQRQPQLKVVVGVSMHRRRPEGWAMMWNPESVHAFLVDSGNSAHHGGSGEVFDWHGCKESVAAIASLGRVIVAGGLRPANVLEPLEVLKPWGVDVASGVEAEPGKKDPEKVRAFVAAVRQAEKSS